MGERTGYVELFVAAAVKNEVQLQKVPPTRWNELYTGCVSVLGPSRRRRSVLRRVARAVENGVQYTIGDNTTCDQYPETVFCNGQLPEGTNFMYGGFSLMHVPSVCVCVCVCVCACVRACARARRVRARVCVCSGVYF